MKRSHKITLYAVGGTVALLVLAAAAVLVLFDANAYKPRLEASASAALGMEVKVGGRLGLGLFPGVQVTLDDVRIRNRGTDLATARQARLGIDFLPLLRGQVLFRAIALKHPTISIERDQDGRFNFERSRSAGGTLPTLTLAKVSLSDATLRYADKRSAIEYQALACSLDLRRLRLADGGGADLMKNLSFTAKLACGQIRSPDILLSDLELSASGKSRVFDLKPVTMRVFGGQGSGSIRADFAGAVPAYQVRYTLAQFQIEEFLKALSPQNAAEGLMDFSANLAMQGKTVNEIRQTAEGQISLRGENLTLQGRNLDREFARYESSQNFNLVDVGAFFLAGPVGLVVTKGYNFASIFRGSGGRSEIRTLVSDWKVEHGVAQAQDVAMATNKNRVALRGGLDFVNERFDHVTVALIDAKGCAKVRQKIRGSFHKPVVEKPNILKSLTGPALELLKKGKELLPGGECDVFYAGSVVPPK